MHASGTGAAMPSSVRARGADRAARGGQVITNGGANQGFNSFDSSGVPGLGFDYVHQAAVHPNARHESHGENNGVVLFPFFDGGYYGAAGSPAVTEAQGDAQQQATDNEDQNAGGSEQYSRGRRADREPAPVVALGPPAPQVDVPEYVFVRRDGTVFFAVAYTWENGTLRYVSREGFRRSVAREMLDLGATEQFNEQRGVTFRAPA